MHRSLHIAITYIFFPRAKQLPVHPAAARPAPDFAGREKASNIRKRFLLHLSVALYSNPWRARWFQIFFKSKEGPGSDPMCPSVNLQLKKRAKGPKILDMNE